MASQSSSRSSTATRPKSTMLAREEADKAPYSVWERQGFLTATEGSKIRLDVVAADLSRTAKPSIWSRSPTTAT